MPDSTLVMFVPVIVGGLIAAAALVMALLILRTRDRDAKRSKAELYVLREDLRQEQAARRKAEQSLQFADTAFRTMFMCSQEMIFMYPVTPEGMPGRLTEANEVACRKLGQTHEKMLTLTPLDFEAVDTQSALLLARARESDGVLQEISTLADASLVDRQVAAPVRHLMRQILQERHRVYERTYLTRDGRRFPVEVTALGFEINGQPMIIASAHDMASSKEAEQALRMSEQRFRDFFATSPLGVAIYDAQHHLIDVNAAFLRMFGIPDAQEFGRFDMFNNPFLPEAARKGLAAGQSVRCDVTVDFDEARTKHFFVSAKRGQAFFDILITHLGFDAEFRPKGYLVQALDVTRRRTTEDALRMSARQLRQAQKMEAIGTLAGGIAHDFNNILTPILGYAEIGLDLFKEGEEIHSYLKEIHKAGGRAKELVNQILAFSRQNEDEGRRKPVRVTPIVKEVLALLRASVPPEIQINRVIKTERDVVTADPTQIHQVIMNLCSNAIHAMKGAGGTLELWLTDFVAGVRSHMEFPELEAGRYLRISVKDSGTGIEPAIMERIFEPFFTTKKSGEGTGMGLSVVHGIVTALGGTIRVESEMGKGSTFHVVLPTLEQVTPTTPEAASQLATGSESILFVDDEAEITQVVAHMLASLGYEPVVTTDPQRAADMVVAEPSRFQLLITDQVMPALSGLELAHKVRQTVPDMPVVLCSGFADSLSVERAEMSGIRHFLPKPIARQQLATVVRAAIDGVPDGHS